MAEKSGHGLHREGTEAPLASFEHAVGSFVALHLEMIGEEGLVHTMVMEVVRGEHRRDDWHVGVQLHPHQAVDHRFGHEFMAETPPSVTSPAATIAR